MEELPLRGGIEFPGDIELLAEVRRFHR
jgi:hypothetical protein